MHTTIDTPHDFSRHAFQEPGKKVIFCIPTVTKPFQQTRDSLAASIPLIQAAGWDEGAVYQVGCPYISAARSMMLRKALDAKADVIVFIDHDLSWDPEDLLTLIETEGEVVSGTYRYKRDDEEYMGALLPDIHQRPQVRPDGCVKAHSIPAGFLKVTRHAIHTLMGAYPELVYGDRSAPCVDLFNHGAHNGVWYGEDYAFARRWTEKCGEIWIVPNLNLNHHSPEKIYRGNFHKFLLRCDGGSESANPRPPQLKVA